MKKIGIITITDYANFGNRLQNYAVQKKLNDFNCKVETIQNIPDVCSEQKLSLIKYNIKKCIKKIAIKSRHRRYNKFMRFNKFIKFSRIMVDKKNVSPELENMYDCFIVGSDQVWNPNIGRLTDFELVNFAANVPKIAFSASFGVSELPKESKEKTKKALSEFYAVSVREDAGKKIINDLGIDKDIEVLVDPTMLLSAEEWDKVSCKPKMMKNDEKYILNYFLGQLPIEWEREIKKIAEENNCKIINILDANSKYYASGPSEFLYLEKNAFLVCTDSFHSSVFSIIYNTPFVVFERKDKNVSMNSRLDTLLLKFNLEDRKFNGKITNDLLKCDYSNTDKILEKEKEKAMDFLQNALDIKE